MKRFGLLIVLVFPLSLLASGFALAADDSKVKAATEQVERGAKKIPDGKIGEGVNRDRQGHRQHGHRRREVQRREAEGGGEGRRAAREVRLGQRARWRRRPSGTA